MVPTDSVDSWVRPASQRTAAARRVVVLVAIFLLGSFVLPLTHGTGPAATPTTPPTASHPSLSAAGTPLSVRAHPSPLAGATPSRSLVNPAGGSPSLQCDGMYWSPRYWETYSPSYCYGHDEPTVSYVSTAPGSGANANFRFTLPADGASRSQGDLYATYWFGGAVYDTASTDGGNQAFLEFQFYPAAPAFTGAGSGVMDCLPNGGFYPVFSAGSNLWFACAIVWQIHGGVEDAGFAGPLNSGSSTSILEMHSSDVLYLNYSGIAQSLSQGWKLTVADQTAGTGGSVTLKNGSSVLSPFYSTAAVSNTLTWGASNAGAIAFAYEIGHALNGSIPGACSPGDGTCYSYWPAQWATAGQMNLELPVMGSAGSQTYPSQIEFSSSQGGEGEVNASSCSAPSTSTATNCIYPWYQYRSAHYGFTYDSSNVANATHTYLGEYQFPPTQNGRGQFNFNTQTAPWGTVAMTVSPLSATVDFNRIAQTNRLTVAPNGSAGGQFEEGPYWLNVSASGCTSISTFVYVLPTAVDHPSAALSCGGYSPLSAMITPSATSGVAPLNVSFSGSASGGKTPYTYGWIFGDGGTSTLPNPYHNYILAGTYTVILTVTDADSDTTAASVAIIVSGALLATASATPTSGPIPLNVQFTGSAAGGTPGYTYSWTFGDGGSRSSQSPAHIYVSAGTFTATLTVTDSASNHNSSSVVIHTSTPTSYKVWFNETGLPSGTNWTVTVVGAAPQWTTGVSLQFSHVNGTYPYNVSDRNASFHPTAYRGQVIVAGSPTTVNVVFKPTNFTVLFSESSLPSGLSWGVQLGGTTNTTTSGSVTFAKTNGTYPYIVMPPPGYVPRPGSGSVPVLGANVTVPEVFSGELFEVSFEQQSLPAGSNWTVTFNSVLQTTSGNRSNFFAGDGRYAYSVTPPAGFRVAPRSGNVTVNFANQTILLTFSPVLFAVTFQESGLPNGGAWSVTVGGVRHNLTNRSFEIGLANGSYRYTSSAGSGYTENNGSGSVDVVGQPVTIVVTFAASSSGPSGFFGATTFYVALAAVAAFVAGAVIYVIGARRRNRPPPSP